ncbi:MAG: UDP-N-acetylglucosamine--N-acetylmuramyl-(pentape ptide) pyrophosphoryl-undecaprenol N-acetylglucosamine transferase [Treponematales bacterium]
MVSIALTGGGTGGHVYPGLAVAAALAERLPCRLFWIGSDRGMERSIVEGAAAGFPGGIGFFAVPSGKLRRCFSLKNFTDLFRVAAGFFAALGILRRERPALLFSKGGFVSVPPCAAAAVLGIPVFSHESDFSPGLATKINAVFSERVFLAYEETRRFFRGKARAKLAAAGNPVRPEFSRASAANGRAFLGLGDGERVLLVLGGSQGSAEINGAVERCLPELTKVYTVVHQTGAGHGAAAGAAGGGPGRYLPFEYIQDEMPHVIAAAELVLCRSGAGTLWECAALGKPLLLAPLQGSGSRGDQVENAAFFAGAGAAVVLKAGFGAGDLAAAVTALAGDEGKRRAMALAASKIAGTGAAAAIAEEIAERVQEGGQKSACITHPPAVH